MASEAYVKGMVKKDYHDKRTKSRLKKYKKRKDARNRGSNTVDLIKAANEEDLETVKKLRAERKRLNELIDEHGKDAPRVRSFMTPAYKEKEEKTDYELMLELKRQNNKTDVPDEELSAQELYDRRQRNQASGGSVKARPAKRAAENS